MKRLISLLLLLALLVSLTGCGDAKDAGAKDAAKNAAASGESAPAPAKDDAILIDNKNDTLIYEDEYCSFTVKWINIGGVTASVKRKDSILKLCFYLEDMTIDGHAVNVSEYAYVEHDGKKFQGIGAYGMYNNDGVMTIFGPASRSDIVGWPGGETIHEISFTLRVVNMDTYPDGAPNVTKRFTLRKAQ